MQPDPSISLEDFDFYLHYGVRYGASGRRFADYKAAYCFGLDLASRPPLEGEDWRGVQLSARRAWRERCPDKDWYEYRDAVWFAWQRVSQWREQSLRTVADREVEGGMGITERMRNWTVLLVDDEPDNLGVAQQILTFYGARVVTACDGEEALEILKNLRPDFIVTDLSMPRIDGWQFLRAVRANRAWTGIPIIALTAHAMRGDKEKALEAGFDQYITKPFRLTTFVADLEACLGRMLAAAA